MRQAWSLLLVSGSTFAVEHIGTNLKDAADYLITNFYTGSNKNVNQYFKEVLSEHGCYCRAIFGDGNMDDLIENNIYAMNDGMDMLCKEWMVARECNKCGEEADNFYQKVGIDCGLNPNDCDAAICRIDHHYATQMMVEGAREKWGYNLRPNFSKAGNGINTCQMLKLEAAHECPPEVQQEQLINIKTDKAHYNPDDYYCMLNGDDDSYCEDKNGFMVFKDNFAPGAFCKEFSDEEAICNSMENCQVSRVGLEEGNTFLCAQKVKNIWDDDFICTDHPDLCTVSNKQVSTYNGEDGAYCSLISEEDDCDRFIHCEYNGEECVYDSEGEPAPFLQLFEPTDAAQNSLDSCNAKNGHVTASGFGDGCSIAFAYGLLHSGKVRGVGCQSGQPWGEAKNLEALAASGMAASIKRLYGMKAWVGAWKNDALRQEWEDNLEGLQGAVDVTMETIKYKILGDGADAGRPLWLNRYAKADAEANMFTVLRQNPVNEMFQTMGYGNNPEERSDRKVGWRYPRYQSPDGTIEFKEANFVDFDQSGFCLDGNFESSHMCEKGFFFKPATCNGDCKLHVFFHSEEITNLEDLKQFARRSGILEAAYAYRMVVLFPCFNFQEPAESMLLANNEFATGKTDKVMQAVNNIVEVMQGIYSKHNEKNSGIFDGSEEEEISSPPKRDDEGEIWVAPVKVQSSEEEPKAAGEAAKAVAPEEEKKEEAAPSSSSAASNDDDEKKEEEKQGKKGKTGRRRRKFLKPCQISGTGKTLASKGCKAKKKN